ncbi:hypothetical protein L9F63_018997 [Diploptera punctata]|uniref:Uncharacterized protein n=1 Tax=Diploptera punctata TaxID=6984 RepID=A0AAD7ZW89_DIPPU|nr:hypothetical protein L9F63_018997 [Diploptera punctata]
MIQLISPPQLLSQLIIPQLLCFSVYNEGNRTKQLEEWIQEIHSLYHLQELKNSTDPISILQTQLRYIIESNHKLEDDNFHLQEKIQNTNINNHQVQKELVKLRNNISVINSEGEREIDEILKTLPQQTAELIMKVVALHLENKECQTAVTDGSKDKNDLIKRAKILQEVAEQTRKKNEHLKEQLKMKM